MEYPASELVLNEHGRVYHLDLSPDMVADKVILVGDPDRVAMVANFFDSVECSTSHREFTSKTGMYKGKRVTVLSTGIGIGNIDITVNELDSLVNIDIHERKHKENLKSLQIVRIGTCGILQSDVPVHSFILSDYAVGLDNVACFYDIKYSPAELALKEAINASVVIPTASNTYVSMASRDLVAKLESPLTTRGITVTSCGFYGPQGRQLRLKTKTNDLNDQLAAFRYSDKLCGAESGAEGSLTDSSAAECDGDSTTNALRIMNFEMESSALFAIGRALGHHCATICLGIANRPTKQFSKDFTPNMLRLIEYVLDRV